MGEGGGASAPKEVCGRWRAAGVACAAAVVLLAPGRGEAGPVDGARIRVLLKETSHAVRVRDEAGRGPETLVEPVRGGLTANRRPVGDVYRLGRDGVVEADHVRFRGRLEVRRTPEGLQVVNDVGLEEYLAGTLGREIYPGWDDETLKAQAVVARSYALHRRRSSPEDAFDLGADTGSQVYGGIDAETPRVRAAVEATRGEYLSFDREPILAAYHSTSGGRTASSEEVWGTAVPYLVSVEVDGEEDSPDAYWRASISRPKLGRALTSLGVPIDDPRDVRVVRRSPSGRALRVQVRGAREVERETGTYTLEARALRGALGDTVIRSTLFDVRPTDDGFAFVGAGYGHGVGMSQWGAQAMAVRGASYREILARFYPGAELVGGGR